MNGPSSVPSLTPPEDRLESWKEIAVYLNRAVTTVQRWERDEGLPVHRQQHDALGSVYAYRHELEAWRAKRALRSDAADEAPRAVPAATVRLPEWPRLRRIVLGAGVLLVGAVLGGVIEQRLTHQVPAKPVRWLTIVPPEDASIVLKGTDRSLTITPDGSRVVYVGGADGSRLFVRSFDQVEPTPIADMGSPRHPFISPDNQWIGFFDRSSLKKVPISGGHSIRLLDVVTDLMMSAPDESSPFGGRRIGSRGAAWGSDNHIVFSLGGRLLRIPADGGEPEILATPNPEKGESTYSWPEYLPDGRGILFTIVPLGDWTERGARGSLENSKVAVLDLRTGRQKVLLEGGSHAHYVRSGHLLYASAGAIKAAVFDLDKLSIVGNAKAVVPGVATTTRGAADFDVALDGTLVYAPGGIEDDLVNLVWVDRQGHEEPVGTPIFAFMHPRLSPDGRLLAVDSPRDLGLWDLSSRTLSWFGVGPTSHMVWTPDGRSLIYAVGRSGRPAELELQAINGTQPATRISSGQYDRFPNAISPDGRRLVIRDDGVTPDLMMLELGGEHREQPLIQTPFRELNADVSPNGQFLTYQSNQSGQEEVYVEPFPNVGSKRWTISQGGGRQPMWAPNGRELFYVSPANVMMSVSIESRGGAFATGIPQKVFEGSYCYGATPVAGRSYDVSSRDGRFLMMKYARTPESTPRGNDIIVVSNWLEELRQNVR